MEYFPKLHVFIVTTALSLFLLVVPEVFVFLFPWNGDKKLHFGGSCVHFLKFSLWKPSYLLTESLCTKTSFLACPTVCSAHLWERFGFDKNYGNVFLLI